MHWTEVMDCASTHTLSLPFLPATNSFDICESLFTSFFSLLGHSPHSHSNASGKGRTNLFEILAWSFCRVATLVWGLRPVHVIEGRQFYRLFTAPFLHADLLHLVGNMTW